MVSTAFAAQISAFTLFGEPDSQRNRGLLGMFLDFLAGGQQSMEDDDMDMEGTNTSENDNLEETENDDLEETENDNLEDIENSGDGETENDDMEETEGSNEGLLESLISFVNSIFGGNNNNNDMGSDGELEDSESIDDEDSTIEENDDMEDDTTDGGSTFGGISFTLNPIDFSGIFGGNNDNDTLEDDSGNMGNNGDMEESEESEEADSGVDDDKEENDASDGGSSFGGVSVSMHPIDLAALFVQVQTAVGMNCSCVDGVMTEEAITEATLRLVEKAKRRKIKKFRKVTNKTEKKKKKKQNLKKKKNSQKTKQRVPKTA